MEGAQDLVELTPKDSFVGTSFYMAPELIENKSCGPACDLWALGLIIFKLYTGESLFKNLSEYEVYQSIK